MFARRNIFAQINLYRNSLLHSNNLIEKCVNLNKYNCFSTIAKRFDNSHFPCTLCSIHQRYLCQKEIDDKTERLQKECLDKELRKIVELYPQPRVTLNEYMAKMPEKICDIHYIQNHQANKGNKKNKMIPVGWTCQYSFVWPLNVKFTGTALSKREAAEKAALQALQYLYKNKKINYQGAPIINHVAMEAMKEKLDEPLTASISEESMQKIDELWKEYKENIKPLFDATAMVCQHPRLSPTNVVMDSTLDVEDLPNEEARVEEIEEPNDPRIHPVYGRYVPQPNMSLLSKREAALRAMFRRYSENNTPLPIDAYANEITTALVCSQVAVIVGEAGCGKSTRVPATILRQFGASTAAIVSQPRRVAAIGLAERVAEEFGEKVGESVGYQVRLQSKMPKPPAGSILYCTSGVLLRRLQNDPSLKGCSHVIIDEAHERDVNTDLTLLLLKKALKLNNQLKLVVMSATLDTDVFTKYFDSPPLIKVPGRTFPVNINYLDDIEQQFNLKLPSSKQNSAVVCNDSGKTYVNCDEIAEVIKAVDKTSPEGAILVFLPGWSEIKRTKELLETQLASGTHMILPVHSRLSTEDQTKIFGKPMVGIRKIVLATNIAETSITIPDVVYVIDSGAQRENRIMEGTGAATLETVWVSQAGATQRAGRAGRLQPGHCYKLYTADKEETLLMHTTPEILRVPLEQTVLNCKCFAPDESAVKFLSQLPEPPTKKAVQRAVDDLIDLGALNDYEKLTRLGTIVSAMALPPRLGAMLVHGSIAGSAVAAANVVTHCSDNVEVFDRAADRREEIRQIKRQYNPTSDHIALHWLQEEYQAGCSIPRKDLLNAWCNKYGLRRDRLNYVKAISNIHLREILKSDIFEATISPQDLNRFSDTDVLTAAIILSGTNAILKTRKRIKKKGKVGFVNELVTSEGDRAHISSESVNYNIASNNPNALLTYFGGFHSHDRRALVVYKSTSISPHTALLFSKGDLHALYHSDKNSEVTVLRLPKHNLQFYVPTKQAQHIINLRLMLWDTFQYYIDRNIQELNYNNNETISKFKLDLMNTITRILSEPTEIPIVTSSKEKLQ